MRVTPVAGLGEHDPVVVVGAGQGGFQVAASLREHGFAGSLTLVGDEDVLPYQRPPLSKTFLLTGDDELVDLRPQAFFDDNAITLRTGCRVTSVNRAAGKVVLDTGEHLDYAHLVLAVGARARALPVPGADLHGVAAIRTLGEARGLRGLLQPAGLRVVVIGGGFIGMEVAAVAAGLGHQVTVIETLPRLMARVSSPELAGHVAQAHRGRGTEILLGRRVVALHGYRDHIRAAELEDGCRVDADVVLVGIGALPNTELAEQAGLAVDDGIAVDEHLTTADPRISAIGDCVNYPSYHAGRRTRLESVQNAVDQARHVAARLTGYGDQAYRAVPWFWTNQFDMRIQMVGIPDGQDDCIVHGDPATGRFSVFGFRDGRLNVIESVNRAADHVGGRKLLATELRPTVEQVRAAGFTLDPRKLA
jgi:3-phenylpropionate/trans-cinnamate dioxygenase ferredoxin reductase subunit